MATEVLLGYQQGGVFMLPPREGNQGGWVCSTSLRLNAGRTEPFGKSSDLVFWTLFYRHPEAAVFEPDN